MTTSSPNRVVCEYFDSLRRLVRDTKSVESDAQRRQTAALAVVMAVNVVEVFLNLWFRVRVEERHSHEEREALLRDLAHPRPASLERKLRIWPKRYLQREIDFTSGPGEEFTRIKALRNSIVHFSSSHETFEHHNVSIRGLADTTEYDALSYESAQDALRAAEGMLAKSFGWPISKMSMFPICSMLGPEESLSQSRMGSNSLST